jgi:hypothetical protein
MEGYRHCTLQVASLALGSLFPQTGAVVEAGQSPGPVGFAEMAGRSPGLMDIVVEAVGRRPGSTVVVVVVVVVVAVDAE